MGKSVAERRRRRGACIVACAVMLVGTGTAVGCGSEEEAKREIEGVTAADITAKYDGKARRITVENTEHGDGIYYATEEGGPWTETNPEYVTPGEYEVYYRIVRAGCNEYVGSARIKIERGILKNITAEDRTYIYDGEKHGIEIEGTKEWQSVTYSTDGERFTEEIELKEPGEYRVYYRVTDEYADYKDECTVRILPDITGRYVNEDAGEIVITETTAIENGQEYAMTYDTTGKGEYDGKKFTVENGTLEANGESYERIGEDERVYRIRAGEKEKYVTGGESIRIETERTNEGIKITVDGEKEITARGNYVEGIAGEELRRNDREDRTECEVRSKNEITTVEVELSERGRLEFFIAPISAVYDGEKHGPGIEFDGEVVYDTEYEFTEPGVYTVRMMLIPRTDYLPIKTETTVTIYPDITGVYYASDKAIELTTSAARVNGEERSLGMKNGEWILDGEKIKQTASGITVGNKEYRKTTEQLLVADILGTVKVYKETDNAVITVDGESVTVEIDDDMRTIETSAGITVIVNGEAVDGIPDDELDILLYILGISELNDPVVFLSVREEG